MKATAKFRNAPFPYFGGKRTVAGSVWEKLGEPKQYIEPFCGSAAVLLAAPKRARLEVIGDLNCYIANFWRCIKFQPYETYVWQDYPVSHVDLDARHRWLTDPTRTNTLRQSLADPEWPGDAQIAGWWVWGQCAWIGSVWCEKPLSGDAGRGVHSKIPHASDAGRGVHDWFNVLSSRLERCRVVHGEWHRMLNHHYGGEDTAIFFDPPYLKFEKLYHNSSRALVANDVAAWCAENSSLRIALCGLAGDYALPGWSEFKWSRGRLTYGGNNTTDDECVWFSPACEKGGELL